MGAISLMPYVSVIIPTYNRDWSISDAIESVLTQTFKDFEIIIVDDGSTDKTREKIKGFKNPKIRYFYKKNGGISSALNLGIKESKGNYIARLDSDDIFLPEKLEIQIKFMDLHPDIGLVYTQVYNTDEKGNVLELYLKDHTYPNESLKILRHFLFPPSVSIMFRKSCINRVGYFDENMPIAEDWDFCIRMAQYYRFAYIDKPLVKVRNHTKRITADKIKSAQAILRVMEKHAEMLSLGEGRGWLAPHYYNLGRLYLYESDYKRARGKFFSALRFDPGLLRNLFFFGLTSLPSFMIEGIMYIKNCFKSRID